MFIHAGKTYSSRYDKRAPIHIAIADDDGPLSLCSGRLISPITNQNRVEITCSACQTDVQALQNLAA